MKDARPNLPGAQHSWRRPSHIPFFPIGSRRLRAMISYSHTIRVLYVKHSNCTRSKLHTPHGSFKPDDLVGKHARHTDAERSWPSLYLPRLIASIAEPSSSLTLTTPHHDLSVWICETALPCAYYALFSLQSTSFTDLRAHRCSTRLPQQSPLRRHCDLVSSVRRGSLLLRWFCP